MNEMTQFATIGSVALGRHTDIETDSICTSAAMKKVMIAQDEGNTNLYVQTECDQCGVIERGRYNPDKVFRPLEEDEE